MPNRLDKPVVLVDMDGVLADFDGATHAYLQANHPEVPIQPRRHFYYRDDYADPAHIEVLNTLHASEGFFLNLPPIDGAIQGWRQIEELGYEPRICSSPLRINKWCESEKLLWIEQYLGSKALSSAIIDSNKELYDGIALIDDRPAIKNATHASWEHIVFTAPYNQLTTAQSRLNGWRDPSLADILALQLKRPSR